MFGKVGKYTFPKPNISPVRQDMFSCILQFTTRIFKELSDNIKISRAVMQDNKTRI